MNARRHIIQSGFTLLEVLVSLVILSGAIAGLAVISQSYADNAQRALVAQQVRTLGDAAKAYIKDNYAAVQAVATPTVPALIDVATLVASGNLTTGFAVTNGFNQSMCVLVLEPTANRLQAMVVAENGSTINDLDLGDMAATVGGSGGGVYSTDATTIKGALGGWQITVATFDNLVNNVNRRCDGTNGRVRITVGRPVMALWFENGDTSAAFLARDAVPGRPELNQLNTPVVLNSVQSSGATCTLLGSVARDASGAILSCQGGVWKAQGSAFWQDAVATFASLPACNAAALNQTRVVGSPGVGTGPRAYTCDGSAWKPLSIDDSGNMSLPGTISVGKLALTDTVTVGAACTTAGTVARESSGQLLNCQSGLWVRPTASWTYTSIGTFYSGSFTPVDYGVPTWAKEVMLTYNCGAYAYGIYGFQATSSVGFCNNANGSAYGQGIANPNSPISLFNPSGSNSVTISAYR